MKMRTNALCLVMLGGAASLMASATAEAGNVGYYLGAAPASCVAPTDVITQAGHTPVAVTQLDAASLAPLIALVVATCGSIPADPDLDSAVAAGMDLIIDSSDYFVSSHPYLPGTPAFNTQFSCGNGDVQVPPGSPIASGPGGPLAGADFVAGTYCSTTGTFTSPPPAGTTVFIEDSNGRANAVGYSHGDGQVAFSMSSFSKSDVTNDPWFPAARTYLTNALAWALNQLPPEPAVTCASEGYTGTKLEWCKNICERGYTGSTLAMWIRRWTDRYRTLPYCAVGDK